MTINQWSPCDRNMLLSAINKELFFITLVYFQFCAEIYCAKKVMKSADYSQTSIMCFMLFSIDVVMSILLYLLPGCYI